MKNIPPNYFNNNKSLSFFPRREICLETIKIKHSAELFLLISRNKDHLNYWFDWVMRIQTYRNAKNYTQWFIDQANFKKRVTFVIKNNFRLIGLVSINYENDFGDIKYWIDKVHEGQGIITECCQAAVSYVFQALKIKKLFITAEVENFKSRAVAKKLLFTEIGISKKNIFSRNQYVSSVEYKLTAAIWDAVSLSEWKILKKPFEKIAYSYRLRLPLLYLLKKEYTLLMNTKYSAVTITWIFKGAFLKEKMKIKFTAQLKNILEFYSVPQLNISKINSGLLSGVLIIKNQDNIQNTFPAQLKLHMQDKHMQFNYRNI